MILSLLLYLYLSFTNFADNPAYDSYIIRSKYKVFVRPFLFMLLDQQTRASLLLNLRRELFLFSLSYPHQQVDCKHFVD